MRRAVFYRIPLLLLFAALAVWGAWAMPQPSAVAVAAAALGGFLAAYARLKHVWLALAASAAPLPGILWFGPAAYALCIAFAILMAADYDDALLREENPHAALVRAVAPLAATLLFAGLWSFFAPVNLASLLAAGVATLLCLPPLLLSVPVSEEAIMRGNRSREKLLRLFTFFSHIAEPRWSISLSGVALVLAVLGYFKIAAMPPLFDWLSAPMAGALLFVFALDVYAGLAAVAASALLLLFTGGMGGAMLLFLLLAVSLERSSGRYRAQGANAVMAARRAIEDWGGAVLFAGLAAMIAAVPRGGALAALHAGCGLIAALVFLPALAGMLRRIFPVHRSVEEMYGTGA